MKKHYPQTKPLCDSDQDHFNADILHKLIGYNRKLAVCVTTSSLLNRAKQYAKKGQNINDQCRIDALSDTSLPEIAILMFKQSIDGMWEWAEEKNSVYLDRLDSFGILDCLKSII